MQENQRAEPQKKGGRAKGQRNKITRDAKENVIAVFTRLGGTAGMARWAENNLSDFYRIYAKLVPTEVAVDATVSGNITAVFRDPTQRPPDHLTRRKKAAAKAEQDREPT